MRRYVRGPHQLRGVRLEWAFGTPYQSNSWARELNIVTFAGSALLKGLLTPADVVIVTIPTLESGVSAFLLSRIKRVPLILNIEDLWPDSLVAMGFRNKIIINILRKIERFLYRRAAQIFVIAEDMRGHIAQNGGNPKTISLLPLGANIAEPNVSREQIRVRYGWKPSEVVCGYVGSHGPANSLDTVIKAAATIRSEQVRFVLFGDGSDKARLREQSEQLALNNVQFMDAISPAEVPSLLRGLDVGLATLKNTELFKAARPTKLFEYMEAGLPIVCAIDGEARHLIEEIGSGIFAEPEDYRSVAQAVSELAENRERRVAMGSLGQRYIREFAGRDKLAAQLQSHLSKYGQVRSS